MRGACTWARGGERTAEEREQEGGEVVADEIERAVLGHHGGQRSVVRLVHRRHRRQHLERLRATVQPALSSGADRVDLAAVPRAKAEHGGVAGEARGRYVVRHHGGEGAPRLGPLARTPQEAQDEVDRGMGGDEAAEVREVEHTDVDHGRRRWAGRRRLPKGHGWLLSWAARGFRAQCLRASTSLGAFRQPVRGENSDPLSTLTTVPDFLSQQGSEESRPAME